jgi:hypothetical protein
MRNNNPFNDLLTNDNRPSGFYLQTQNENYDRDHNQIIDSLEEISMEICDAFLNDFGGKIYLSVELTPENIRWSVEVEEQYRLLQYYLEDKIRTEMRSIDKFRNNMLGWYGKVPEYSFLIQKQGKA